MGNTSGNNNTERFIAQFLTFFYLEIILSLLWVIPYKCFKISALICNVLCLGDYISIPYIIVYVKAVKVMLLGYMFS